MHQLIIVHILTLFICVSSLKGQWQSELIKIDSEGNLTYNTDKDGFKLPDFSYAGFQYGENPLPNIPVVKEISPIAGDNTAHIQQAIDEIALLQPDKNGYKGALLLKAGTYEIFGTIYMYHDGIVLRGVGQENNPLSNTILWARGNIPNHRTVIQIGSKETYEWDEEKAGSRKLILNDTVHVGDTKIKLENTDELSAGDNIIVYHPCTAEWLDTIDGGGTATDPGWTVDELPILFYRYVKSVKNDTIELDAPIFNPLVKGLSQCYIYKHASEKMKHLLGIEELRIEIENTGGVDENHAWNAVRFKLVEDGWARNCTVQEFGQAGFVTHYSYKISIDNCSAIDPVAIVTGERMYNFNFYHGSQLVLVKDSYARNGRHHYISNGTTTVSGCVVYNCISDASHSAIEGHRKWTTGLLFDNLKEKNLRSSGRLVFALYNRGDKGTSHGWSSAHCVAWNCDFGDARACIQKPPYSQNYAIGCHAKRINGNEVDFPQEIGFVEGTNTSGLVPASLYKAQLGSRIDIVTSSIKMNDFGSGQMFIYPNPNEGSFIIKNNSKVPLRKITIYSMNGELQLAYKPENFKPEIRIDSGLSSGLYLLTLSSGLKNTTRKIIVN